MNSRVVAEADSRPFVKELTEEDLAMDLAVGSSDALVEWRVGQWT